jgi:hypothetical protein
MTIHSSKARRPPRQFQRPIGIAVGTMGVFVLISTLTWLIVYFAAHGFSLEALKASFGNEFAHWSAVLILSVPGLLLIFHGKRMMRNQSISLFDLFEVLALMVTTIAVFLMALR